MRNEKKERKAKRKEKKGKKEQREKNSKREKGGKGERRKGKRKIFRLSGGRRSTVRILKLVHAVGSTCRHQKVGVSTNSKR